MKIAIIYAQKPVDPRKIVIGHEYSQKQCLGGERIVATAIVNGHDARMFYLGENLEDTIEEIVSEDIDVVGISAMAHQMPLGRNILKRVKSRKQDVLGVVGGWGPMALEDLCAKWPDQMLAYFDSVDFMVTSSHFGEQRFIQLLNAIQNQETLSDIPGLAFRQSNKIIVNKEELGERVVELTGSASSIKYGVIPREILALKEWGFDFPAGDSQKNALYYDTWRGCLHKCRFCATGENQLAAVRSINEVIEDLTLAHDNYGTNLVLFTDDTWGQNRKRYLELCNRLEQKNIEWVEKGEYPIWWEAFMSIPIANHDIGNCRAELLEKAYDAGCRKWFIGIESYDDQTLEDISKNQRIQSMRYVMNYLHKMGFILRASYMVGYPDENIGVIKERFMKMCEEIPADSIRISKIIPIPGSVNFKDMNAEDLDPDLSKYDTTHLVTKHARGLTDEKLDPVITGLYHHFYTNPEYHKRLEEKFKLWGQMDKGKKREELPFFKEIYRENFKILEEYFSERGLDSNALINQAKKYVLLVQSK